MEPEDTMENEPKIEEKKESIKKKLHRNKKIIPEVLEIEKPEVETISYSKANELTRKKRVLSDKQKENVLKLIQLNKARREKAKLEKQEQERKAKELEEAKAKKKLVKVLPKRVHKKKVVEKPVEEPELQTESEEDEEMPKPKEEINLPLKPPNVSTSEGRGKGKPLVSIDDSTDGDTTDTREIKRKVKKLQTLNKLSAKQVSAKQKEPKEQTKKEDSVSIGGASNPYLSVLKNSGYM